MDDIQELIGKIMSDPQSMSQLENMGRQLGLDIPQSNSNTGSENRGNTNRQRQPQETGLSSGSLPQINQDILSGLMKNPQLLSLLGGMMNDSEKGVPRTGLAKGNSSFSGEALASVAKLMPLLSSLNTDDDTTRLLEALRPFLGTAKQKKLDEAKKMLRLLKILPLIKSKGIL